MSDFTCTVLHNRDRADANCLATEVRVGDTLEVMNTPLRVESIEVSTLWGQPTNLVFHFDSSQLNGAYSYTCAATAKVRRIEDVYDGDVVIDVQLNFTVTAEMISDLIVTAIETPAGTWLGAYSVRPGAGFVNQPGAGITYGQEAFYKCRGWSINFEHENPNGEEGEHCAHTDLNAETCAKALGLMAAHHPRAWADLMGDNMDSETADVFMQLACFGDIIYG